MFPKLTRSNLGKLQLQQGTALTAHKRLRFCNIHGRGVAAGTRRGRVRGFRKRIGRLDSRELAALRFRDRLKSGTAIGTHVIETTVGGATVKHLVRVADGAGDLELAGFQATASPGRKTPGRRRRNFFSAVRPELFAFAPASCASRVRPSRRRNSWFPELPL